MITSCQPRPQPHNSGMAASRATSGMATNTPTSTRWKVEVASSSKSGRTARGRAVAPVVAPVLLTVSGEVVIVLLGVTAGRAERLYAYVTVAYQTVGLANPRG